MQGMLTRLTGLRRRCSARYAAHPRRRLLLVLTTTIGLGLAAGCSPASAVDASGSGVAIAAIPAPQTTAPPVDVCVNGRASNGDCCVDHDCRSTYPPPSAGTVIETFANFGDAGDNYWKIGEETIGCAIDTTDPCAYDASVHLTTYWRAAYGLLRTETTNGHFNHKVGLRLRNYDGNIPCTEIGLTPAGPYTDSWCAGTNTTLDVGVTRKVGEALCYPSSSTAPVSVRCGYYYG
jgi:hypothetical protein